MNCGPRRHFANGLAGMPPFFFTHGAGQSLPSLWAAIVAASCGYWGSAISVRSLPLRLILRS